MKVLAYDPGYERLGVALLEKKDNKETLLYSACLQTEKEKDIHERIFALGERVEELITTHAPDAVALEKLFFNKNQKTAIAVAEMRGVLLYLGEKHGCLVREYTPQEIKVAVTGYGKSDKEQVIAMVKQLLPHAPQKALDDEYDAIAVGLTFLAIERYPH